MPSTYTFNYEVTLRADVPNPDATLKKIVNVFHYSSNAGVGGARPTEVAVALAVIAQWSGAWAALFKTTYVCREFAVRNIDDPTIPEVLSPTPTAFSGVATTGMGSSIEAAFFRLNTSARGRSWHGRKHIGPLLEANYDNQELNSAGVTAYQNLATTLRGTLTFTGLAPLFLSVVSRKLSNFLANPSDVQAQQVTSITIDKTIGTMRRRRPETRTV